MLAPTSTPPVSDRSSDRRRPPDVDRGRRATEAQLLAAARRGDELAFGDLYESHLPYAFAVANRVLGPGHRMAAEDVVQTACVEVFGALRRGGGPTDVFRHYLATAVRRHAWRWLQRQRQLHHIDATEELSDGQRPDAHGSAAPGAGDDLAGHALLQVAFRSLPSRMRTVLWMTEVEGRRAGEGGHPSAHHARCCLALAYRSRRRLATAYLDASVDGSIDDACSAVARDLVGALRPRSPGGGGAALPTVEAHLARCGRCRDLVRGVDLLVG